MSLVTGEPTQISTTLNIFVHDVCVTEGNVLGDWCLEQSLHQRRADQTGSRLLIQRDGRQLSLTDMDIISAELFRTVTGLKLGRGQLEINVTWSLTILFVRVSNPKALWETLPPSSLSAITAIEAGGDTRPPSLCRVVSIFMGLPGALVRWLSH